MATLEREIIAYSAPTLAALKTANMFRYKYESEEMLMEELQEVNVKLNEKGVFVKILKMSKVSALMYVYRRQKLEKDLSHPGVQALLKKYGYTSFDLDDCVERLKNRIALSDCFPHEIGVFLNYPLHDVIGFIEQKGQNCKYSGLWKVYHNEHETIKLFAKFKKCTDVYIQVFANGRNLAQLTVTA